MKNSNTEAKALRESALLDLISLLKSASSPADFLASADDIFANPDNLLSFPVNLGEADKLNAEGQSAVDVENAPVVHEYLGELDRANAADARLWVYLAFVTYREYMEERWPLKQDDGDDEKWKNRVEDRWIIHPGRVARGRLIRHGIARLWWVAHLTYDEKVDIAKSYALTKEVFKKEDRLNAIFDREVGAIPVVMKTVLEHAMAIGARATESYIRQVMQYLTLVNGYRDVGSLDRLMILDLIEAAQRRASSL
ncbi:DUF6339 family protein [Pseudoalteromonas rubra]|uniref:DUF6339 family protein n=1 Tax=Pseudoalteromonas rubra TaxID=43658 RepID=UPI002DBBDDF5|nr:DUF6339 family protein [Pseudoalteromonas rubra]MEC4088876.1 DUF6339 family protein [Pseudoalteromonas rubra]